MNIAEFRKRFPDDVAAEAFFASKRWEEGKPSQCSHCGHKGLHQGKRGSFRCYKCRKYDNLYTGTIFKNSLLSSHKLLLSIYIIMTYRKTWDTVKFSKKVGITYNTSRRILKMLEQFKPSKKIKDLEVYFEMIVKRIIMGLVSLEKNGKAQPVMPKNSIKPNDTNDLNHDHQLSTVIHKSNKNIELSKISKDKNPKQPVMPKRDIPVWIRKRQGTHIKIIDKENIGYGVNSEGNAFLTGNALADTCGIHSKNIYDIRDAWNNPIESSIIRKIKNIYAESNGDIPDSPCLKLMYKNKPYYTFDEKMVIAIAEYYAFDKNNEKAQTFCRTLLRFAFRTIVFEKVGYNPAFKQSPFIRENLKEIQAKKNEANPEDGIPEFHWIVVRAITEFILELWHLKYAVDAKVTLEGSVGHYWSKWMKKNHPLVWENLKGCLSRYAPDDLRGRGGVEFEALCYHEDYYFEFMRWLKNVYKKTHLVKYTLEKWRDKEMGMENVRLVCDRYGGEYPKELIDWINKKDQDDAQGKFLLGT